MLAASDRISSVLRMSDPPIRVTGETFRVVDVAGLIRLAPNVELEVAPKFLGEEYSDWREDFFASAILARYGHLFPRDALRGGVGAPSEIADLIGHAMVVLYDRAARTPLRVYRHEEWRDFEVSGELSPESVLLPDADGFLQSGLKLDRQNEYNAVILGAIRSVVESVRGVDVRRGLTVRAAALSPQRVDIHRRERRRIPARHAAWRDLYDLSYDVLSGFGVRFTPTGFARGRDALPGYVLRTADAWEDLLRAAVRVGLPDRRVEKLGFPLGTRRYPNGREVAVMVTPDVAVFAGLEVLPLDAKFKHSEGVDASVSASDLYEALAFMRATGSAKSVLLYPSSNPAPASSGETSVVQRIDVEQHTVLAAAVSVRGLSQAGGFDRLARGLGLLVREVEAL